MENKVKVIWKHELSKVGTQLIEMPQGAVILGAGLDPAGSMCVWEMHDDEFESLEMRQIMVVGTGMRIVGETERKGKIIDDEPKFIGFIVAGVHVWHVFEIVKVPAKLN